MEVYKDITSRCPAHSELTTAGLGRRLGFAFGQCGTYATADGLT